MSTDQLRALIDQGEERGCVNLSAFSELVQELELDDEAIAAVYEQLDQRGIELTDDCANATVEQPTYVNGDLAVMTTDSLQLFLNEAGRYPLLTAAEEVELAKRIERGDKEAKDIMINSNLRLVVQLELLDQLAEGGKIDAAALLALVDQRFELVRAHMIGSSPLGRGINVPARDFVAPEGGKLGSWHPTRSGRSCS